MFKVYVLLNENRCIHGVQSSLYGNDTTGWTLIDEGNGDRYMHAGGCYLKKPVTDERGVSRYRVIDDESAIYGLAVIERTQEEMDEEYASMEYVPTDSERIAALEEENKHLKEALDLLLSGVTEEGADDNA